MKFRIDKIGCNLIDISTLAELKAYALGGTGVIKINYVEYHPMTGEKYVHPKITQVED